MIYYILKTNPTPGAAVKSPLILGNDIRIIQPSDLALLSNPAVIAVNQDPMGSSAARRWLYETNQTDAYGKSSIQMWSGSLESTTGGEHNDYVVVLINGNNATTVMNATLADIFNDSGPAGTAEQVKMSWEVRDLWANRMNETEARDIISASSASGNETTGFDATRVGEGRYNATKTSYAEGLAARDPLLLGKVAMTVKPEGTIVATVDPHGAAMFRLRARSRGKDEL